MKFDKESKSRIFLEGEGEVCSYGGYKHESHHILYTRHIVTTSSTEMYSFTNVILVVFKIESVAASRENNSESMQAKIVIPVCDISSRPVLQICKVS